MDRTAAFFDLDKTMIATSAPLAFVRPMRAAGLLTRRSTARAVWAKHVYLRRSADANLMTRIKRATAANIVGLPVDRIRTIVRKEVDRLIVPLIYPEARELLAGPRGRGHELVLVSSSGLDVVQPIAAVLDIPHVIATRMSVADGRYTGELDYFAYAEEKVRAVRRMADERGYDLASSFAYSDSITDVPLLRCVGRPVAVNPDRRLRELAIRAGWPIRDFARPPRQPTHTTTGLSSKLRRSDRRGPDAFFD